MNPESYLIVPVLCCYRVSFQKCLLQLLCPQGELQLLPASPDDSPRSASRSDPGTLQTAASVPGLKVSEVSHVPFKSSVGSL